MHFLYKTMHVSDATATYSLLSRTFTADQLFGLALGQAQYEDGA